VIGRLPIRVRVTAVFALATALVLAASGLFLYLRLGSHLTTSLDRGLRVRAQDLGALVRNPGASLANDTSSRLIEAGEAYAELLAPDGRVLDATPSLRGVPLLSRTEARRALRESFYGERRRVPGLDEPSRLFATAAARNGKPVVLVAGATLQDRAETLAVFRDELLIAGPIALILASGVGYLLAGLSLRQVEEMRRRASVISASTPGERLPVPPTGDELERLGETLNEMLDRLEAALEREREFVADAGHELRTPLASLRTELELALRQARTPEELRAAVSRSTQEVERLSQLAEDLLVIARSDRGRLPLRLEDLEVDALLGAVASRFEWRAAEAGKTVQALSAPGLEVHGDRIRLEQALANLVDNGLRHGGGTIRLSAGSADGRTELHVRDDGPGFPAEFLGRAFERFSRADPARTGGGSGLGLSIVRAIAEAHGGTAGAANVSPRGTDVWLSVPARQPGKPGV
jgi:two-component system, OmpR family, sensor kinase